MSKHAHVFLRVSNILCNRDKVSYICLHIYGRLKHKKSHRHRFVIDREYNNLLFTLLKVRSKDKLYMVNGIFELCI